MSHAQQNPPDDLAITVAVREVLARLQDSHAPNVAVDSRKSSPACLKFLVTMWNRAS